MDLSLKFLCPRWGFEDIPWPVFLKRVKEANYAGIEWFPYGESCDVQEVLALLKDYDLDFAIVMTVIKSYANLEQYLENLKQELSQLMEMRTESKAPLFFSAQIGREYFTSLFEPF
jgi:sugar phosphate isomerase/epimerase